MDESNPVKDILYDYLKNFEEEKIISEISARNSPKLINDIILHCYPKIQNLQGNYNENIIAFGTSLLHYLLTEALVPSQRKVQSQGLDLDIVIPDLRTLSDNPRNSLVICMIDSKNQMKKVNDLLKIQPIKENIWLVLPENFQTIQKSFIIGESSFSTILVKIMDFVESTGKRQFKIFKN